MVIRPHEGIDERIEQSLELLKRHRDDPLWPLKMFRGWLCNGNTPDGLYPDHRSFLYVRPDYSDPSVHPSDQAKLLFDSAAAQGRALTDALGDKDPYHRIGQKYEGICSVLSTAELEEAARRLKNERQRERNSHPGMRLEEERFDRFFTVSCVGGFYGEKFNQIVQDQSRLALLHEEGLITPEEFTAGIAQCTRDLDRLGFNGVRRMVEGNPALKEYLLNDTKTIYPLTVAGQQVPNEQAWERGAYLKQELKYYEEQIARDPHFNPDYLDTVYEHALAEDMIGTTLYRLNEVESGLRHHEKNAARLETPNAQLYEEMLSDIPNVRREAEKTFLMKHFYPITDLTLAQEHPQLEQAQRHLLTRMMEESYIKDKTIEEVFAIREHPYRDPSIVEGHATTLESEEEVTAVSGNTEMVTTGKRRDHPRQEQQERPRVRKPEPREPITIEGEFVRESDAPPSPDSTPKNENLTGKVEETESAVKRLLNNPKKLAFGACAVALVGTVGWYLFKRTQEENKQGDFTEKSLAR